MLIGRQSTNGTAPARFLGTVSSDRYGGDTMVERLCSKVACRREAVSTLTYVYADSMAVLGPLSTRPEPHTYDLCVQHSERLSAPRGWQVLRHVPLGNELST